MSPRVLRRLRLLANPDERGDWSAKTATLLRTTVSTPRAANCASASRMCCWGCDRPSPDAGLAGAVLTLRASAERVLRAAGFAGSDAEGAEGREEADGAWVG